MKAKLIAALVAGLIGLGVASQAQAGYTYVGSWQVHDGPSWTDMPAAYTGRQAAALLFGGSPSDYAISTVGTDPALVDHFAWYSVLGYYGYNNGGIDLPEDYVSLFSTQASGLYYSGNSYNTDGSDAASAYVADNAGDGNRNYAFRITNDIPEPGSLLLVSLGLMGVAAIRRRSK